MGLSLCTGPCDETAPIIKLLASVVSIKGYKKSGCERIASLESRVLQNSKASLNSSSSIMDFLLPLNYFVMGWVIRAKSFMNFVSVKSELFYATT